MVAEVEPSFFNWQRQHIPAGILTVFGVSEGWAAQAARIDAPQGFDDRVWAPGGTTDTIIAWHAGGPAEVACEWGPRKGHIVALPGDRQLTLQPKGSPNHYSASGPVLFNQFVIPSQLLRLALEELGYSGASENLLRDDLIGFDDPELYDQMNMYVARARMNPTRLEIEARAILVVERLLTKYHDLRAPRTSSAIDWRIRRAIEVMECRLGSEFSLAELANATDLSISHFVRQFRKATGQSPHAWLMRRRVDAAARQLARTSISVTQIAHECGFGSSQHFATVFRREMGVTPSEYRARRRS